MKTARSETSDFDPRLYNACLREREGEGGKEKNREKVILFVFLSKSRSKAPPFFIALAFDKDYFPHHKKLARTGVKAGNKMVASTQ